MIKMDTAKGELPPEGTPVTLILRAVAGPPPAAAALAPNPERQVQKLSRSTGPGDLPAPAVAPSTVLPVSAVTDPFEHRREVRNALKDSAKPVDVK